MGIGWWKLGIIDSFRIDGQVAVVTGAGQGIGRGFALALAEAGADVAVIDINGDTVKDTANEISKLNKRSMYFEADVTNHGDISEIINSITSKWGRLDIGVNNAGAGGFMDAVDYTEDSWDAQMSLNLKSVFMCAQQEFKAMLESNGGNIINTASISGVIVNRGTMHAAYNTAKAGVIHMTRSLAVEWAPHGVRVNAIAPGNILTPAAERPEIKPWLQKWADMNPTGRLGNIDDLQGAVVFLASSASKFITGHTLMVDGGYTLW